VLTASATGPFMLPWHIARGGRTAASFDPDLGRAVAALLPPKFLNRARIGGEDLPNKLAGIAEMRWSADLAHDNTDERYGALLAPLRARFQVTHETIGHIWGFNANGEVWDAHLTSPDDPRVDFDLWLTASRDQLASPEPFLHDAPALARRVRSIPWIARLLKARSDASVSIEYRDDHSLSGFAQTQVLSDLRRQNQTALANEVAGLLDRSVGVYINEPHGFAIWILLPDGRAFLHFSTLPPHSGMPAEREGALVTPEGALVPIPNRRF
jgi:hypothetical protein